MSAGRVVSAALAAVAGVAVAMAEEPLSEDEWVVELEDTAVLRLTAEEVDLVEALLVELEDDLVTEAVVDEDPAAAAVLAATSAARELSLAVHSPVMPVRENRDEKLSIAVPSESVAEVDWIRIK